MELDLNTLATIARDHAGASVSAIATAMGAGLLITIGVIVLYGRFGVFRRPGYTGWHILSKFWIPFLVFAGLLVSFKAGTIRAVHGALQRVAPSAVDAIYRGTVGDALATEADKQAFLLSIQSAAKGTQDLGKAIAHALKTRMHAVPDSAQGLSGKAAAMLADLVIDHYQEDLTTAVLYGVYAKSEGYLQLHHAGKPVDYATFKEGVDHLMQMDVATMQRGVQANIGRFTTDLLERQYHHFMMGVWMLALLLALVPLIDRAAFALVVRQRKQDAQPPAVQPPPATGGM